MGFADGLPNSHNGLLGKPLQQGNQTGSNQIYVFFYHVKSNDLNNFGNKRVMGYYETVFVEFCRLIKRNVRLSFTTGFKKSFGIKDQCYF